MFIRHCNSQFLALCVDDDIKTDLQYLPLKADSIEYSWNIWNHKHKDVFLIPTSSKKVVGQEELESSTFAVSERHSNQLNY